MQMATLNGQDLTFQKIPKNIQCTYSTLPTGSSLHTKEFQKTLGKWNKFEMFVRERTEHFRTTAWGARPLAPYPVRNERYSLDREHLKIGNEDSVLARFGQNVGHVMTAVMRDLGYGLSFGDWKTCAQSRDSSSRDVPDSVVITDGGECRAVGKPSHFGQPPTI